MKKSLFQSKGKFYRANLHGHTNISDGKHSPEEVKAIYKNYGYDILAYSDHDVMINHEDLNDEEFLALTAVEYEFQTMDKTDYYNTVPVYHTVLIAPKADFTYYPWPNPIYANCGNAAKYIQPYVKGDCSHSYDIENVKSMLKEAHEHGMLVTYCHPCWSSQHYPDYCDLTDVDLVETYNCGSFMAGYELDATDAYYHDFLCLGSHSAPTASDDGHNLISYGGGSTFIKADSLTYEDVFKSLKAGDSYASWGPEIKDIIFDTETNELTVLTSNAKAVYLETARRHAQVVRHDNDKPIYKATFNLSHYFMSNEQYHVEEGFVRIVVVDHAGRKALSRGYRNQDFMK